MSEPPPSYHDVVSSTWQQQNDDNVQENTVPLLPPTGSYGSPSAPPHNDSGPVLLMNYVVHDDSVYDDRNVEPPSYNVVVENVEDDEHFVENEEDSEVDRVTSKFIFLIRLLFVYLF